MSDGQQDPFPSSESGAPQSDKDEVARMGGAKARDQARQTSGELLPRLGARIIDIVPFSIGGYILDFAFDFGYVLPLIQAFVVYAYFVLLDAYAGTTVGKRLLGLRVTGPTGDKPELSQAAVRESFIVVGAIPFVGVWLVPILWIVIAVTINSSPVRQGKHDQIAGGTRVIKA